MAHNILVHYKKGIQEEGQTAFSKEIRRKPVWETSVSWHHRDPVKGDGFLAGCGIIPPTWKIKSDRWEEVGFRGLSFGYEILNGLEYLTRNGKKQFRIEKTNPDHPPLLLLEEWLEYRLLGNDSQERRSIPVNPLFYRPGKEKEKERTFLKRQLAIHLLNR